MFNIGAVIIVFAFLLVIILLAVQLCRMPYLSDGKPYMAKGATGVMVRTLGEMFR